MLGSMDGLVRGFAATLVRVRRSPVLFWVLSVLAALVGAAAIRGAGIDRRYPYGALAPSIVLTRSVQPGDRLRADDVRHEDVPTRFRPADAIGSVDAAVGHTVRVPLRAGTVVGAGALADGGASRLAAATGPDHLVLSVEIGAAAVPARVGDLVTMLVTADGSLRAEVVAQSLRVVERGERRISVRVRRRDLGAVAAAPTRGVITLAIEGV
jgi:Flp pilus assembly protein CpaB